jgi:hypothetical protein
MFRVRARGGWARVTRGFCSARSMARGSFAAQTSATAARTQRSRARAFFPRLLEDDTAPRAPEKSVITAQR